jgi:tight adherence protein C
MSGDYIQYLAMLLAFGGVALSAYVIGQLAAGNYLLKQRLQGLHPDIVAARTHRSRLDDLISTHFSEGWIKGDVKAKLKQELLRAGFFNTNALNYYIFFRLTSAVVLPATGYLLVAWFLPGIVWYQKLAFVIIFIILGVLGPDAYIARRKRKLQQEYRIAFPDLLDLLVVCVDAGLSIDAAFVRITDQILEKNPHLGKNLLLMSAEIRSGRSTLDAMDALVDRIDLEEARIVVAVLRQSIELGTDVNEALRVNSDEMRDRRLLRAEELAHQLPVKMVIPLGLFIFPVLIGMILFPLIIRIIDILFNVYGGV